MCERSTRLAHTEAPRVASAPTWLATAMVSVVGARSNPLDRHLLAVLGYLQGNRARYIDPASILRRWPWSETRPTRKGLLAALQRMTARQVLVHRDGAYRVNRDLQGAAADRSCRFRYVRSDFGSGLSGAAVELLALVRGRAQGRRDAWGDSIDYLADLLGTERRAAARAMAELRAAGRVEVVAEHRLRTGHRLPVLAVRETTVPATGCSENARPVAGNACPPARNACPPIRTFGPDLASLGSSRGPRLLTWSPEPEPPSADQNHAFGVDDPIRSRTTEPQKAENVVGLPARRVVAPWLELEGREHAAASSLRTWATFEDGLRAAVAALHLAPASVECVHRALIAAGMFLATKPLTAAGRLGLRRRRVEVAELLVAQRVDPSLLLEGVHLLAAIVRRRPRSTPRSVGAALLVVLAPKDRDCLQRSRERVAAGETALPMAAGADALARLVQPHKRLVGEFAYPASWWRHAVPQQVLDRIADLRALIAGTALAKQVREDRGEVAAERLRAEFAKAERERRVRQLAQERDGATRRARGRLVGAAHAGDWHRVAGWLVVGITTADVATWSGVPEPQIVAGIATIARTRTA